MQGNGGYLRTLRLRLLVVSALSNPASVDFSCITSSADAASLQVQGCSELKLQATEVEVSGVTPEYLMGYRNATHSPPGCSKRVTLLGTGVWLELVQYS